MGDGGLKTAKKSGIIKNINDAMVFAAGSGMENVRERKTVEGLVLDER